MSGLFASIDAARLACGFLPLSQMMDALAGNHVLDPFSTIRIGSHGRYLNNPALFGRCVLGDGSQILGNITVDSCTLADGGSFREDDPDLRAGLLKGSGVARNLTVARGMVIAGNGTFSADDLLPQRHFHPKA